MAREKDAVPKPSKIRERKLPLTRGFQCLPRVRKRTLLGATRGGMATERVHAQLSALRSFKTKTFSRRAMRCAKVPAGGRSMPRRFTAIAALLLMGLALAGCTKCGWIWQDWTTHSCRFDSPRG